MNKIVELKEMFGGSPLIFIDKKIAYTLNGSTYDVSKHWKSIEKYSAIIQTSYVKTAVDDEEILFVLLRINRDLHLVLSCYSLKEMTKSGHYFSYQLSNRVASLLNKVDTSCRIRKKGPKEVWKYLQQLLIIRLHNNKAVNLLTTPIDNWDGQDNFVQKHLLEKTMVQAISIIISFDLQAMMKDANGLLEGDLTFLTSLARTLIKQHPDNQICTYLQPFVSAYHKHMEDMKNTSKKKATYRALEETLQTCKRRYQAIIRRLQMQEQELGIDIYNMVHLVGTETHALPQCSTPMETHVVCVPQQILTMAGEKLHTVKAHYKARRSNHDSTLWSKDRIQDKLEQSNVHNLSVEQCQALLQQDASFLRFTALAVPYVQQQYNMQLPLEQQTPMLREQIYVDGQVLIGMRRAELWMGKQIGKHIKALQAQWHACLDGVSSAAAGCECLDDWAKHLLYIGRSVKDMRVLEGTYGCPTSELKSWIKQLASLEKAVQAETPFLYGVNGTCDLAHSSTLLQDKGVLESYHKKLREKAKWKADMLPEEGTAWLCALSYLVDTGGKQIEKKKNDYTRDD